MSRAVSWLPLGKTFLLQYTQLPEIQLQPVFLPRGLLQVREMSQPGYRRYKSPPALRRLADLRKLFVQLQHLQVTYSRRGYHDWR